MSSRPRLWPRTIRGQLIVGVAGIHLVLMTLFVGDLVVRQRSILLAESVEQTRTLARTLAVSSASWVLANDVEGLQEVVRAVQADPDFRYLMILTREGRVLAHSDDSRRGLFVNDPRSLELLHSRPEVRTIWAGADSVDVAAPILSSKGTCIGWARVGHGQSGARASLAAVTRNGVAYTILAVVFGATLAIVVGRRMTKGLHGLVQVSRQVRGGCRDVRAQADRADEIGQLGRGLNEMLDTLAEEERRVKLLLDSTAEGILGSDLDGRCTFSNPAALSLLGFSRPEELQGANTHDLIHHHRAGGTEWPAEACRVGRVLVSGEAVHVDDEVFWRLDGTSFPVEYRAHPILRDGSQIGLVVTFTDVTMRRRAEEEVRRAHELLERMFESIHVAVAYLDRSFGFIRVNRAYAAADEHEPEFYVGKNHFDLFPNAENEAIFRRVVETGETHVELAKPFEYAANPERGVSYWDWRLEPVRDHGGGVLGLVFSLLDVTNRIQAEGEVRRLNTELEARVLRRTAELEAVNRELEAFSYSVSHDLRAPLRAIDGFSKEVLLAYTDRLDAEGIRLLTRVCENTARMSQLIDDLLALSRVSRHEVRDSTIDMAALARAVWGELMASDAGPPAELRLGPIPPAAGDATLVRQIWMNLLSNALKFSAKGERRLVEVGSAREGEETAYFVRDNGAGFDPTYADKLFGAFQRLHSSSEFEGTGIGLAIVLRIVQRHGGRVRADGAPGRGATFSFTLGGASRL